MNRNLLKGFIALSMSFASLSYADFSFRSNDEAVCEHIAGQWTGNGKASNWMGSCEYHGVGLLTTVDNSGRFVADVSADKVGGSILCPAHASKQLTGTCHNGVVTIITEHGDLVGNFTANEGSASGTLSISPGVSAEVAVKFVRSQ